MIAWLTRRFSSDPGQLGLFESGPTVPTRRLPAETAAPGSSRITQEPTPREQVQTVVPEAVSTASRDPVAFLHTLRGHGLRGVDRLVFTRNRRTMVSLAGGVLRVHEGFVAAPTDVHAAIATFATSRNRARRSAARNVIVAFPVPLRAPARRPAAAHPDDVPMSVRLTLLHAQLNLEHFAGALESLEIEVSRRLARRLGHYTPRSMTGSVGEIVIARRHVRRDGWSEAIHTLLHEMVHQWQDETGQPVDHGAGFRRKCRSVGIQPAATRMLPR